jgi:hypothetical protein
MNERLKVASTILCLLFSIVPRLSAGTEEKTMILKVRYTAVEGTDIEYGQGAIERNELEHGVLDTSTWLIRIAAPGDPRSWEAKLNASVDPSHGCFHIEQPTEEELRRVESGEVAFQK